MGAACLFELLKVLTKDKESVQCWDLPVIIIILSFDFIHFLSIDFIFYFSGTNFILLYIYCPKILGCYCVLSLVPTIKYCLKGWIEALLSVVKWCLMKFLFASRSWSTEAVRSQRAAQCSVCSDAATHHSTHSTSQGPMSLRSVRVRLYWEWRGRSN